MQNPPQVQQETGVNDFADEDAEKIVLASLLSSRNGHVPSPDLFFFPDHRIIYGALAEMEGRKIPPDIVTLTQFLAESGQLKNVDPSSIAALEISFAKSPEIVAHELTVLAELHAKRKARAIAERMEAGTITPAEAIKELRAIENPGRGELPAIEDASVYVGGDSVETPREVIEGILHRAAKAVIGGSSKTYKTWTLTDMGMSVASGGEWLGRRCIKGRVLYINLELQRGFFAKRVKTIAEYKPGFNGGMDVWNLRGYATDLATMLPMILEQVSVNKYALIIVDPIYKVLGGRDENKAGDIGSLLNELERLAVESGAAVVFGAHFSKGNQSGKESIDRIGGSGVFARDPDSILVFTKHEEEDAFTVEATLRNHPPIPPFAVRWEFPLMRIADDLDPTRLKKVAGRKAENHTEELLAILDTNSPTTSEWLELSGKSKTTFYRLLDKIEKAKSAETTAGKWARI